MEVAMSQYFCHLSLSSIHWQIKDFALGWEVGVVHVSESESLKDRKHWGRIQARILKIRLTQMWFLALHVCILFVTWMHGQWFFFCLCRFLWGIKPSLQSLCLPMWMYTTLKRTLNYDPYIVEWLWSYLVHEYGPWPMLPIKWTEMFDNIGATSSPPLVKTSERSWPTLNRWHSM